MTNIAGLAVFAVGIVLLIIGFSDSQEFAAEASRAVTLHLRDRSLWLVLGGAAAVVTGLTLAIRSQRA